MPLLLVSTWVRQCTFEASDMAPCVSGSDCQRSRVTGTGSGSAAPIGGRVLHTSTAQRTRDYLLTKSHQATVPTECIRRGLLTPRARTRHLVQRQRRRIQVLESGRHCFTGMLVFTFQVQAAGSFLGSWRLADHQLRQRFEQDWRRLEDRSRLSSRRQSDHCGLCSVSTEHLPRR